MAIKAADRVFQYLEPVFIMVFAGYFFLVAIVDVLFVQRKPRVLFNLKEFRDLWFAKFWLYVGPMLSRGESPDSLVPRLVRSSAGVVVELGPGNGEQLSRYDMEKITHIYGLEPCLSLIPSLKANVEELGLQDKYTIVPYGVEDSEKLEEYGIKEGGVDTVLSIRVLCSVGNVEEAVEKAYKALRPGGRMVFFEHVRSKYWFPRMLEEIYNILWPYMISNCNLNRPTDEILVRGLEWEEVNIREPKGQESFATIPYVYGTLVKPMKAN